MKIQIVSDLHKEFGSGEFTCDHVIGDVLVLAGDTHVIPAKMASCLKNLGDVPKIMVLGNHEFYGNDFFRAEDVYRDEAALGTCNGYVLEMDSLILDGTKFIGATLWTDYAEGMHLDACMSLMSDFRCIKVKCSELTGDDIVARNKKTIEWMDKELALPFEGPKVIITHHAPSYRSCAPKYAGERTNGGYFNKLDWLIEKHQPTMWIHGHTHESCDYLIGRTRIVCNPYGYYKHETNPKFKNNLISEV